MRFVLFSTAICLILAGCNADPRYRRETALMRAEMVDLEDRFVVVRAQRDAAIDALHGKGKGEIAEKIMRRSPAAERTSRFDTTHDGLIMCDEGYPIGHSISPYAPPFRHAEVHPGEIYYENDPDERAFYDKSLSVEGVILESNAPSRSRSNDILDTYHNSPSGDRSDVDYPSSQNTDRSRQTTSGARATMANGNSQTGQRQASDSRNMHLEDDSIVAIRVNNQASFEQDDPLTRAPGVRLLLEPLDSKGQVRLETGSLDVSLIDPYRSTVSQRIGIWKFLPEEVELFIDDQEVGILLHLPYQGTLPRGDDVKILVRYRTRSGRLIETSSKIPVGISQQPNSGIRIDHSDSDLITDLDKKQNGSIGSSETDRPVWRPIR